MDGASLLAGLRADPRFRELRVVLSTASGRIGSRKEALAHGFDGFLPKPVRRADVLNALRQAEREPASLDCRPIAPKRIAGAEPAAPDRVAARAADGLKILLTEDSPVNQQVALLILSKAGHEVAIAGDGLEALAALERDSYDLVLMDMQMPNMDGIEATRRIRALEGEVAQIPIIAMTANAMPEDKERCLRAGMNDYVAKPIDTATLLEKIAFWGGTETIASGGAEAAEIVDREATTPKPVSRNSEFDDEAKRAFDDLIAAIE
jgi:CheY-like chemotaxis protein